MSQKGVSMIDPPIVDLLEKLGNRYSLVIVTAKRARQIIDGDEPMMDTDIVKPVTISINEIEEGLIDVEEGKAGVK